MDLMFLIATIFGVASVALISLTFVLIAMEKIDV